MPTQATKGRQAREARTLALAMWVRERDADLYAKGLRYRWAAGQATHELGFPVYAGRIGAAARKHCRFWRGKAGPLDYSRTSHEWRHWQRLGMRLERQRDEFAGRSVDFVTRYLRDHGGGRWPVPSVREMMRLLRMLGRGTKA